MPDLAVLAQRASVAADVKDDPGELGWFTQRGKVTGVHLDGFQAKALAENVPLPHKAIG